MLEAVFTTNLDEIKISGLTQWDRGQVLRITSPDLPTAFQVHFTNRARATAIPVQAASAGNVAAIPIPDEILREPYEVRAYLYFTEGDVGLIGETVKTIRLPITPRAKPEDYIVDLSQEQLTDAEILIDKMMTTYATQAANAATAGALSSINNALKNLPEGDTLVINDLTTGGTTAALSAEMGKELAKRPSPNLLHNWYFANPVNQRGEKEYPSGVRKYTIDRWIATAGTNVTVNENNITVNNSGSAYNSFIQPLAVKIPAGTQMTLSCLTAEGVLYSGAVYFPSSAGKYNPAFTTAEGVQSRVYSAGDDDGTLDRIVVYLPSGVSFELVAMKLELGSVQTLARRDSNGAWVLNEIPDYGEELLKCQRYYQLFSSEEAMPKSLVDYRPTMLANPATGTIDIGGVTYWYADANL